MYRYESKEEKNMNSLRSVFIIVGILIVLSFTASIAAEQLGSTNAKSQSQNTQGSGAEKGESKDIGPSKGSKQNKDNGQFKGAGHSKGGGKSKR